jgi:hypothetical protein
MAMLTERFPAELVYKIIDQTASIGRQKVSNKSIDMIMVMGCNMPKVASIDFNPFDIFAWL